MKLLPLNPTVPELKYALHLLKECSLLSNLDRQEVSQLSQFRTFTRDEKRTITRLVDKYNLQVPTK